MLFITHDFAVLKRATTRSYVLHEGAVVESGDTLELLASPHTVQARRLVRSAKALSLPSSLGGEICDDFGVKEAFRG